MKKLIFIPVVGLLVVITLIAYSFISNASPKATQVATKVTEEERQQGKGNENVKQFDDPAILLAPISTNDQRERSKQILLIRKNALDSGTIFIGANCSLSPLITIVRKDAIPSFMNEDSVPQTFTVNGSSYRVEPEKRVPLEKFPVDQETQLPITCDGGNTFQGYLYFIPESVRY